MNPPMIRDDRAAAAVEASEVSITLAGTLELAGVKLPQFAVRHDDGDYLVRLGACNVRVATALNNLILDGLTLRAEHPEESVNAGREDIPNRVRQANAASEHRWGRS